MPSGTSTNELDPAPVVSCTDGENIAGSTPVADSPDATAREALALTINMLSDQPPDDTCRRNILSSEFHHLGIVIYRDNNSGTMWMIQVFST